MAELLTPDICIIGAGSGGLLVAAGASQLGANVVLLERNKMGGDCLNYGCIPSKAIIAAGKAAQTARKASRFGIVGLSPRIEFQSVHDHVHDVIANIAPNDSIQRYEGLGVHVIREEGHFVDPREVEAGNVRIRAKKFVIASGSSPRIPPIDGINDISYLTNETIFELKEAPSHLIVLGGGPLGCELAQAYRRLGAEVTVLDEGAILSKEDPELATVVKKQLLEEGIEIKERTKITAIKQKNSAVIIISSGSNQTEELEGSHLLIAAGRVPNLTGLDLEAGRIEYAQNGILTNKRLLTSNNRVYALGDVIDGPQYTHAASYQAGVVIRNILFKLYARVNYTALPRVTYTDPEIAQVGMSQSEALEQKGSSIRILRLSLADNDRAVAERAPEGIIKVLSDKRGKILGCSIAGAGAGELIMPWALAISQKLKVSAIASTIAPYPSLSEISKRAASSFYAPTLFSEKTKKIVRALLKFSL